MLGLLVYQGLKTEELSRLEVNQIDLRKGKIDVLGSKKNNGRLMQLKSHQVMDMYDYILKTSPELQQADPRGIIRQKTDTQRLFIVEGAIHHPEDLTTSWPT
jgi:integrase/recombinase XerD